MSQWFHSAPFTRASVDIGFGSAGDTTRFTGDTALLGWYGQRHIRGDGLSYGTMVGLSMGYRYQRERAVSYDDRIAVLHFPGLGAEFHARMGAFSASARVAANVDFAAINALANDTWNAAYPDEQGKTTLRKQGYCFGFGGSGRANATLAYGPLRLGASLWRARYNSDEGLDRIQESVTVDQKGNDAIFDTAAWLDLVDLPWHGFLRASFDRRRRNSVLEEFSESAIRDRFGILIGLAL